MPPTPKMSDVRNTISVSQQRILREHVARSIESLRAIEFALSPIICDRGSDDPLDLAPQETPTQKTVPANHEVLATSLNERIIAAIVAHVDIPLIPESVEREIYAVILNVLEQFAITVIL